MQEQGKLEKTIDECIAPDEMFVVALGDDGTVEVSNRDGSDRTVVANPVGRQFEEDVFVSGIEPDGVIHLQTRDGSATVSVGVDGNVCGEVGDPDRCLGIRDAIESARQPDLAADKHWGDLESRAKGLSLGEGR